MASGMVGETSRLDAFLCHAFNVEKTLAMTCKNGKGGLPIIGRTMSGGTLDGQVEALY